MMLFDNEGETSTATGVGIIEKKENAFVFQEHWENAFFVNQIEK
ncbi:hypothetical protein [Maribacter aquimaris]|nr:hypothetical protein [Maribacter aquimaris]